MSNSRPKISVELARNSKVHPEQQWLDGQKSVPKDTEIRRRQAVLAPTLP
tara:strand:+ start:707 stop:856 length:150 start_codon:yes stop_codon:yes gene_type:complete